MVNPALVYEGGKLLLKAIKTDDASSAESSSTVDVNQYRDTPMEIKRTEGDLGYDETPVQEETPQAHIDEDPTANPMEVKEVADVAATDKPQDTLPQSEPLKPLGSGFSKIFSKDPDDASESFDDFFGKFLDEKESNVNNPVNYASTQGTGSSAGIPSGAPAIGSKEQSTPAQPLNVPKAANPFEEYQDIFDEFFKKKEEPLIQQAEKAYEDDKDIDDKELPFVEDDKAAEDVEDVVQAVEEGSLDEEKAEEVLQKANDGGKIEDGELDLNSVEKGSSDEKKAEDILQEAAADDGKIEDDELGFDSFLKSVEEGDPNYKFSKALDERFGDNFQAKNFALEALKRKFTDPNGDSPRKTLQGMIDEIEGMDNSGEFNGTDIDDRSKAVLDFVESQLPGSLGDQKEDLYQDDYEKILKFAKSKLPWISDKVYPVSEEVALDQFGKLSDEEKEKLLDEIEGESLRAVDRDAAAKERFWSKIDAKNAENKGKLEQQNREGGTYLGSYKNPKNELENEPDEEKIPQKAPSPAPSPSINEKPQASPKPNQGKNATASETPKDEEKKGVLDTINGKLDEANDKWEKSPAKALLDKGVKLGSIIFSLFKTKSASASASSGETVGVNPYEAENASTTSGGMGYDEESGPVESTSSSGSAPSSGGSMSNISDTDYGTHMEQPVNTRVASQAGSGSIESESQKGSTSSGSTSSSGTPVKGSVKEAFNKILAQGAAYSPSREGSSFESALGGGRIGSSGGVSGGSLGKLPKEVQTKMQSEYEKIKQKVQATYKSWPKKRDLHVKEKGSVSIRTENGKEIGVKFGTRRQVSLESVAKNAPEKLGIVEEVI